MAKNKQIYICRDCGFESPSWYGVCPECNAYGSFEEETVSTEKFKSKGKLKKSDSNVQAVAMKQVRQEEEERFSSLIGELDRVLGGGIVSGSLVLVGGEPGIGKSTLLLQVAHNVSKTKKVLYISGEESQQQIKLRAQRLYSDVSDFLVCNTNDLAQVELEISQSRSQFVIIDSVQTISCAELSAVQGSVSQVKEVTARLMEIAKGRQISIFLVGHVTKEGSLAGPKVLEHLVDTVIYFEGERYHSYRMIRAVKNRFGSTNELGLFEMTGEGLKEISNPSALMLSEKPVDTAGSVIVATMEGSRPIMNEVQALTSSSFFPVPRRTATGVDYNRMNMLLAVLEKKAGLRIQNQDVYVNLTGGFRNSEPSIDLAIILAVASSYRNIPIGEDTVIFGEVGLTGEIRSVQHVNKRVAEAKRLGFKKIVLPFNQCKDFHRDEVELIGVKDIGEAIRKVLKE